MSCLCVTGRGRKRDDAGAKRKGRRPLATVIPWLTSTVVAASLSDTSSLSVVFLFGSFFIPGLLTQSRDALLR
jgi:hypothetical protein